MMRRIAVVGDKLDNDGEVCPDNGMMFTLGDGARQAALINGDAYCPVCETTGYIAKDGGPRRMTLGLGEIALDQDLVICGCPEHPRISAKLAGEAWYDDLVESLGVIGSRATASGGAQLASLHEAAADGAQFDEQVRATVSSTGFHGYPYLIEAADGQIVCGRTDSTCLLPRIYTDGPTSYAIHWGDDALSHKGWSDAE